MGLFILHNFCGLRSSDILSHNLPLKVDFLFQSFLDITVSLKVWALAKVYDKVQIQTQILHRAKRMDTKLKFLLTSPFFPFKMSSYLFHKF